MMEKLTNQTIKHILGDISKDIKNLTEIATKTNGRVSDLEMLRNRVVGALAVVTMILIPIILQYISKITFAYFK